LGVALDDGVVSPFEVDPFWNGVVGSSGGFVFRGLHVDWHARKPHVVAAVVEMEMGVDDESNVVDAVAVRFQLCFDRAVNNLVVAVEVLIATADPRFVQEEPGFVAKCEREDFPCLPAKRVRVRKRDSCEMKRDQILEGELRHLSKRMAGEVSSGGAPIFKRPWSAQTAKLKGFGV
jgi:hypothetical protein